MTVRKVLNIIILITLAVAGVASIVYSIFSDYFGKFPTETF